MTNQLMLQAVVAAILLFCVVCPVEPWIIDSGALFHAITCKDTMINFKTRNFKKVNLTDAETFDIIGKKILIFRLHLAVYGRLRV